jgi:hypothetical protein
VGFPVARTTHPNKPTRFKFWWVNQIDGFRRKQTQAIDLPSCQLDTAKFGPGFEKNGWSRPIKDLGNDQRGTLKGEPGEWRGNFRFGVPYENEPKVRSAGSTDRPLKYGRDVRATWDSSICRIDQMDGFSYPSTLDHPSRRRAVVGSAVGGTLGSHEAGLPHGNRQAKYRPPRKGGSIARALLAAADAHPELRLVEGVSPKG